MSDDRDWDYEPEYDLEEARRQNEHAYKTLPAFRAMCDRLWTKGKVTAQRWKEDADAEPQMRLPLREFCPWMDCLERETMYDL